MRIGFDAKRAFFNNTGLGNYSRATINALCRMLPEDDHFLYTPLKGKHTIYSPPENATVRLPSTIWGSQLKSYWRTYGLAKQLAKEKIDIYHGLSNEIPVGIERTGVKSIVTIHDLIFMRLPHLYSPLDRRIYEKKVRNAVRNADRLIAISRQTKEDLRELFGADEEKIRVLYQGCNPGFTTKKRMKIARSSGKNTTCLPIIFFILGPSRRERIF